MGLLPQLTTEVASLLIVCAILIYLSKTLAIPLLLQAEHDEVEAAFQAEKRALELKYDAKFGEFACMGKMGPAATSSSTALMPAGTWRSQ
jgi:hypothetical protein